LRSNDHRLVRIGLSPEAKSRQSTLSNNEGITESVLKLLSSERDINIRGKAAEAVHLMANENHGMAQRIGLQSWLPGSFGMNELVGLVRDASAVSANEDVVLAGEEAAEAIWVLIRSSVDNLEMAIEKGAIDVFVNVIMVAKSPRLTMLAAASLKRLLHDQYNTVDGTYSSSARKIINNEKVRKDLIAKPGFIERLVRTINDGRINESTLRAEWPRHSVLVHRTKPSIQGWAAAGSIGTIALNHESHKSISSAGGITALCSMKHSPDLLESVEASYALQILDEDCSGDIEL
jgi:hypothetical protein